MKTCLVCFRADNKSNNLSSDIKKRKGGQEKKECNISDYYYYTITSRGGWTKPGTGLNWTDVISRAPRIVSKRQNTI